MSFPTHGELFHNCDMSNVRIERYCISADSASIFTNFDTLKQRGICTQLTHRLLHDVDFRTEETLFIRWLVIL